MNEKKESYGLDALFDAINGKENTEGKSQETVQNINGSKNNPETEPADHESDNGSVKPIINIGNDFAISLALMKALKPEHKTKTEVSSVTNKKVVIISRILGVNGHALIDIALNEFLDRNKKEIDKAMRQMMK